MGLNATKVLKNMQGGIKMLNKYHFKDGVAGLEKMAKLVSKLGVKMEFAAGMSDKLWNIEGAVDMSAQLQVMGGEWAKMSDPFQLMFKARNDMEGLTEQLANAAAASMHFGKNGKDIEMSAVEMSRLKIVAQETGVEYDELIKSGRELFKMNKVKSQIQYNFDPDTKEFIANTAEIGANGKATIKIGLQTKDVSTLTKADKRALEAEIQAKKSLEERALASQNFDDQMTNIINMIKTYMLPIIEGINEVMKPIAAAFTGKKFTESLRNIGKQIGEWIIGLKPVFEGIGKFISFLGPKGTLAVLFGGKMLMDAAMWLMNGVNLGTGFMSVTKTMGGASSSWAPGQTGPAPTPTGGVGGAMPTALKASGLAIGGAIVGMATDAIAENQRKKGNARAGDNIDIGGSAISGGMQGAAMGMMLAPVTGGLSVPIGAALGAIAGGGMAYMNAKSYDNPAVPKTNDFASSPGHDRQLLSRGEPVAQIPNKDKLIGMEPNGVIDKSMKGKDSSKTMKVEHSPIEINGKIIVELPGGKQMGLEMTRIPGFIDDMATLIQVNMAKRISGGKSKG